MFTHWIDGSLGSSLDTYPHNFSQFFSYIDQRKTDEGKIDFMLKPLTRWTHIAKYPFNKLAANPRGKKNMNEEKKLVENYVC